ncbi:MAG TPA: ribonuclease H-like domain-containing protein [Chloroflexota bacterium]|nr:ribonuclease H-like domain-containing protein [Chloroflexota bacterium]
MPGDLASKLRQWNAAGRAPRPPREPRAAIEHVLPGRYEATSHGECFVVERRYPVDSTQGRVALRSALQLSARARHLLTRGQESESIDPARALFLDTETTGLAGGTGTYAFLVGAGYFDGAEFCLRQYFMRHPSEEAALLAAMAELLARFPLWVTFNGKTFDVPLLETRFLVTRRERLSPPAFHLDLLHPARRLWRTRLPSCALGSLERLLLGVQRLEDVPAWTIPGLYFEYVRQGRCEPLAGVFAHNAEDLLSLVALLGLLGAIFDEPTAHAHRVDPIALLRLFTQAGLATEAAGWCSASLERVPPTERRGLQWEMALLLRRAGDREGAVALWQQLAAGSGPWALAAQVELAKHYEHHRRDYLAATRAAEAALAVLSVAPWPVPPQQREELQRRLGRLHYRLARQRALRPASAGDCAPDAQPAAREAAS